LSPWLEKERGEGEAMKQPFDGGSVRERERERERGREGERERKGE
jgi:hypothetical protein